jgi:hypothetical protein
MAILSSDARREQLHRLLDEMLDRLPPQLRNLDDAEQCVEEGLRRLGRASMQAWADAASTASAPPSCPACKTSMRHRGLAKRTLVTLHGAIDYARPRRRCERCSKESYPDDATVCFASHGVSWLAAQKVCRLGSLLPSYEMTRTLLSEDYGVELCKHSIEQIVLHAGQMLLDGDEAAREACFPEDDAPRRPKESAVSPDFVAVYADGTMIHTEDDWREIRVGRVIADDEQGNRKRQRTFARFLSTESFGQHLFVQAHAAGYGKAKRRAFLGDGAHWLWELASLHFPEAVPVLDWFHLSENVHAAADAVFGEATEAAKQWAKARLDELWAGDVRRARRAVAEERKRRRGARREAMRKLGVYLKNNAGRMDYARYREQGLPIGSGPVEAMCKTLVGGRCKQAGMRNWTRRGAEAVLRLRAAQFDDDFRPLWETRLAPAA